MALLLAKGLLCLFGTDGAMAIASGAGAGAAPQHAQNGVGGALAQGNARLVAAQVALGPLVEELDHDREANGRIQVALGHVKAQAFGQQAQADHEQKAQAQHDHGGVGIDKIGQRLGGQQHHAHGNDDGGHHHRQVIDHAHGGDDRIEREHRVQQHDLRDHNRKTGPNARPIVGVADPFQALVQLRGGLEQQEQAAHQQDERAPGKLERANREQRRGQCDQPRDDGQQPQAHEQGQGQANDAGAVALFRGEFVRQDGDEDQVVHPQDNLQHDQG